jgi:hypothetical protein
MIMQRLREVNHPQGMSPTKQKPSQREGNYKRRTATMNLRRGATTGAPKITLTKSLNASSPVASVDTHLSWLSEIIVD